MLSIIDVPQSVITGVYKQAEQGKVCQDLLHQLLKDDFYYKSPPKSTGREAC